MCETKNTSTGFRILFLCILLCITACLTGCTKPNDDYETGNTAGNLNNKGLFCEQDDIVYFSNAYDNNVLYSMNPDESNVKRLNNVAVASLNADKERIFYSQSGNSNGSGLGYIRNTHGLYYCDHRGKNTFCYTKDLVGIVSLLGNNLYYQHYQEDIGVPLIKVSLDNKESSTMVSDMVSPACVSGTAIYYAGNRNDHYLYALDTTTGVSTMVWEHPVWNPIYQNGYVYYMDLENNYSLHRYEPSTGEDIALTTERIDFFNVYDTIIYYQTTPVSSSQPALKRIYIDGTGEEIVMEGVFESVNITSQYAYFNEFKKPTPVYHQSTFGGVNPSVFNPVSE